MEYSTCFSYVDLYMCNSYCQVSESFQVFNLLDIVSTLQEYT